MAYFEAKIPEPKDPELIKSLKAAGEKGLDVVMNIPWDTITSNDGQHTSGQEAVTDAFARVLETTTAALDEESSEGTPRKPITLCFYDDEPGQTVAYGDLKYAMMVLNDQVVRNDSGEIVSIYSKGEEFTLVDGQSSGIETVIYINISKTIVKGNKTDNNPIRYFLDKNKLDRLVVNLYHELFHVKHLSNLHDLAVERGLEPARVEIFANKHYPTFVLEGLAIAAQASQTGLFQSTFFDEVEASRYTDENLEKFIDNLLYHVSNTNITKQHEEIAKGSGIDMPEMKYRYPIYFAMMLGELSAKTEDDIDTVLDAIIFDGSHNTSPRGAEIRNACLKIAEEWNQIFLDAIQANPDTYDSTGTMHIETQKNYIRKLIVQRERELYYTENQSIDDDEIYNNYITRISSYTREVLANIQIRKHRS